VAAIAGACLAGAAVASAHDPGDGCSDLHEYNRVTIVCGNGDNHFVGTGARDYINAHGVATRAAAGAEPMSSAATPATTA
jgi:hypothetical protein